MSRLVRSQHLSWFQRGEAVFLYHDLYGFLLEMSLDLKGFLDFFSEPHVPDEAVAHFAGTFAPEQCREFGSVFAQTRALVAEGEMELDGLADAYPIKGPWIVAARELDGTVTAVTSRGFGHEPWAQPQVLKLDPWQSELWRRIDGERSIRQLAADLTEAYDGEPGLDLGRAIVSVAAWTHASRQLTRVLLKPKSQHTRLPPYATSTMPYAPLGSPQGSELAHDLAAYHQEQIDDAEVQFEERETTLSHLFCEPHPALGGQTYGEAVARAAWQRGWLGAGRARVVEVGGGTGRLAEALLRTWQDALSVNYTIIELSPELQAAQQRRLAAFAGQWQTTAGHAERLELADASVDFLLSNEALADFRIGFVSREALRTGTVDAETTPEALEIARHYQLTTHKAPEPIPVQMGATRFIEQVARVLAPGGHALLTEFGAEDQYPIESTHLDHAEWSVHFGHLMTVARQLGLEATLLPLPQLLGLQADVWVLACNRTQFRNLRHLVRLHGGDLKKRALTPDQLALACGQALPPQRIEGLQFRPAGERVMGLVPNEFQALVLHKPDVLHTADKG